MPVQLLLLPVFCDITVHNKWCLNQKSAYRMSSPTMCDAMHEQRIYDYVTMHNQEPPLTALITGTQLLHGECPEVIDRLVQH